MEEKLYGPELGSGGITARDTGGTTTGSRPRINFVEGTNITITVAEDAGDDEIDVTIDAGGGGGITTEQALDFVGAALTDSSTIDFTFNDAADTITASVIDASITLAKMANLATDRLIGRDTAGSGVPEALTVGGGIEFTTSGGIQRSALTGEVTASAGSNSTTIANNAVVTARIADANVTLAKLANIATDRLLGRDTAGSGVPEELTVGGGVEFTTSGGIQRSALTGDVTASAGSASTTIANNAVTTAKINDGAVTNAKRAAVFFDTVVALSDGANIATDASLGNIFTLAAMAGNRTMDNPTNGTSGQRITYRFTTSTSRTITWGSEFRGSTDVALMAATTGSDKTDYVVFIRNAAATKWDQLAINKGFG